MQMCPFFTAMNKTQFRPSFFLLQKKFERQLNNTYIAAREKGRPPPPPSAVLTFSYQKTAIPIKVLALSCRLIPFSVQTVDSL